MSRYKVVWSQEAQKRLDEIHEYISSSAKSNTPADKFILKLIDRTVLLASFPFSGQEELCFKTIGKDRRYLVQNEYKIIYRIEDSRVIITDVFHTKQNPHKLTDRDEND